MWGPCPILLHGEAWFHFNTIRRTLDAHKSGQHNARYKGHYNHVQLLYCSSRVSIPSDLETHISGRDGWLAVTLTLFSLLVGSLFRRWRDGVRGYVSSVKAATAPSTVIHWVCQTMRGWWLQNWIKWLSHNNVSPTQRISVHLTTGLLIQLWCVSHNILNSILLLLQYKMIIVIILLTVIANVDYYPVIGSGADALEVNIIRVIDKDKQN